jgi:PAS domain S-box-containing protein
MGVPCGGPSGGVGLSKRSRPICAVPARRSTFRGGPDGSHEGTRGSLGRADETRRVTVTDTHQELARLRGRVAELERFERIVAALPIGVVVLEVSGAPPGDVRLAYANTRSSAESQLDLGTLVGKTLEEVLPDELAHGEQPAYLAAIRRLAANGGDEVFELDRGARGWADTHYVSIGDRSVMAVYQNVTARKHAERALRQSEARFHQLADAMPQMVCTAGADGAIDYYNQRWFDYTGMSAAESAVSGWGPVIHAEDLRLCVERWDNSIATGELFECQYRIKRASDGSYRWHLGRAIPVRDDAGAIIRWFATCTDIDDNVRAAEMMRTSEVARREVAVRRKTEKRFLALIESAPDAMVIVDAAGKITLVNAQTERLFGYARSELEDQQVEMLLPERAGQKHLAHRAAYAANPRVREMGSDLELYGRRKDGTEFPIEVSLAPIATDEGMLVSTSIRDITARRETERRLRETEERFRLLVGSVKDYAIFTLDATGHVASWNSGAERIKGYTFDEIVGRHFSTFYGAEDVAAGKPESELRAAAANGHHEDEGWRVRKDGSRFLASVVITAVSDASGKLVGFAKVTRDITARHVTEVALKHANAELEAFSYSVAHDLRAPLRGMNGFAQLLLSTYADKLDADGKDWLREIGANASKMGELIDGLLSLTRVTRSDLRPERVDLTAVARASASQMARGEPAHPVDVVIEENLVADVDPRLARAIFDNLLGNAWKFTRDVAAPRVEIGVGRDHGDLAFFVRDNGAGFDMAYADKLFSPFQRLHTVDEFPGTGIGLATVQRIIDRHGGRIWAEGHVDQGATFNFTLPGRSRGA